MESEWISVDERLPEGRQVVLAFVASDGGPMGITTADYYPRSQYREPARQWIADRYLITETTLKIVGGGQWTRVTHWMPLPPAPRTDDPSGAGAREVTCG